MCTGGCQGQAEITPSPQSPACVDTRPWTPSQCWWSTDQWCWRSGGSCYSWSRWSCSWSWSRSCTKRNINLNLGKFRRLFPSFQDATMKQLLANIDNVTIIMIMMIILMQIFTFRTQQTPKPLAQDPSAVPPISLHSLAVKHVPLSPVTPPHSVFSNWTQVIRLRN